MSGQQLTEDNFDDVARQAGDALRRPAPADGMAQIRRTRRRQQQVRAATGAAAVLAIVAIGAVVATRGNDEPALLIQPDETVSATTLVPNETVPTTAPATVAPTTVPATTPPTTAPAATPDTTPLPSLSTEAQAWIDARVAEGSGPISVSAIDGTGHRMLATLGLPSKSAVLLTDGRVVDTPTYAINGVQMLGDKPAVVQVGYEDADDERTQVWALDVATLDWASTGDLGLEPFGNDFGGVTVVDVGDQLIVANNMYVDRGDGTRVLSPDQAGVVVAADLTVTDMAPAPEGVPLYFSSASAGKALQMYGPAIEGGIGLTVTNDQPWQYDPVVNEWSEIPAPAWSTCTQAGACDWSIVPDIGAIRLEASTDRGLVVLVPDGTVGLYDAATSTWTRMDDAPFELAMPSVSVVGDQVVAAPWRSGTNDFSQIGVLDVADGTWSVGQIDIPADIEARFGTEWFDVTWNLRVAGTRVLAAPGPAFQPSPIDPIAVYDTATRTWGGPTDDDVDAWQASDPYVAD